MNYRAKTIEDKIVYDVAGCAMRVHSEIGNGFQEAIYQRALEIEMRDSKLNFGREVDIPIYYKEFHIGNRRVDFLVERLLLVELKAVINLEDVHLAQAKNYLEAFKINNGLLINFGSKSLTFKRLYNRR